MHVTAFLLQKHSHVPDRNFSSLSRISPSMSVGAQHNLRDCMALYNASYILNKPPAFNTFLSLPAPAIVGRFLEGTSLDTPIKTGCILM